MEKKQIVGLNLREVEEILCDIGCEIDMAREICVSVYRKRIVSFTQIQKLPLTLRKKLDVHFSVEFPTPRKLEKSIDGTVKYLFVGKNKNPFETAFMPGGKRNTLCISTQSGCRMGCSFCQTGSMGYLGNLSSADIVGQLLGISESKLVNKIVLMGMGEPLDNFTEVSRALDILTSEWGFSFGASNITLSTVGIIPYLKDVIDLRKCNLAISFHSPWPEVRGKIMPIERIYPFANVLSFLKQNPLKRPLRLSFEYMVIPGINDSEGDAKEVVQLLSELRAHVNIIPYNSISTNENAIDAARKFQRLLNNMGLPCTFRISKGHDISAACGMMAYFDEIN